MTIGEPQAPAARRWSPRPSPRTPPSSRLYPPNDGTPELRAAIAGWLARRYGVAVDPETQLIAAERHPRGPVQRRPRPLARDEGRRPPGGAVPNPFYQAYGAGALAVGAEPVPVPATAETGFLPDYAALPPALLDRVTLATSARRRTRRARSPTPAYWRELIALAERHDFRILADECYSEIYRDTPPPGRARGRRRRRRRPRAGA